MSLRIRSARVEDVPAMSRVLIASITELCGPDHRNEPEALAAWTANKSVNGVASMLENAKLRLFVAERNGEVLAVGGVTLDGEVALNYVAPQARFGGISKAMLVRLEAELVALGFAEAQLESTATARRFYQAAGWLADGPQASGRGVNGYPMRKQLLG
ncbi:GNAT family N-acetyltransferase [Devosia sp. YIM 151766]|uniref:GNAT family N-acetyltransferase n=1 Tax=Devosia sp. YIM 151766 TaxID=3017325 RepID=UPI00255CDB0F|nr:GNAT family N-acetyltransferase [Devosia sp. YIM 151766]WIY52795.1 GNAT family N-acetyltransferase [Devosia sp. YIM 151766]